MRNQQAGNVLLLVYHMHQQIRSFARIKQKATPGPLPLANIGRPYPATLSEVQHTVGVHDHYLGLLFLLGDRLENEVAVSAFRCLFPAHDGERVQVDDNHGPEDVLNIELQKNLEEGDMGEGFPFRAQSGPELRSSCFPSSRHDPYEVNSAMSAGISTNWIMHTLDARDQ